MGFWSAITDAAREANEEAHGKRLHQDLYSTLAQLQSLPEDLRIQSMEQMDLIFRKIKVDSRNWTTKGKLGTAKSMFLSAYREVNFNKADSIAIALCAIWLESWCREGPNARAAFLKIDNLLETLTADSENKRTGDYYALGSDDDSDDEYDPFSGYYGSDENFDPFANLPDDDDDDGWLEEPDEWETKSDSDERAVYRGVKGYCSDCMLTIEVTLGPNEDKCICPNCYKHVRFRFN
jgi:hypothetical protein